MKGQGSPILLWPSPIPSGCGLGTLLGIISLLTSLHIPLSALPSPALCSGPHAVPALLPPQNSVLPTVLEVTEVLLTTHDIWRFGAM